MRTTQKERKRTLIFICFFVVLICLGLFMLYKFDNMEVQSSNEKRSIFKTITIDGKKYIQKSNISTYLFIGEDAKGKKKANTTYNGTGQCDVLQLLIIDKTKKQYIRIPINRDTITAVKTLDDDGSVLATTDIQLSYAHANGDGMEKSCENTADAVSHLFYEAEIQEYACLNLDGIKLLNNLAGGVDVTIEDDFSQSDPSLIKGQTIHLNDDQALHYIHDRMNVGDGTNECRMRRQEQYLHNLSAIYKEKIRKDEEFSVTVYKKIQDYMVTSITLGNATRLGKVLSESEDLGKETIRGEETTGEDGYIEFHPDKASIKELAVKYLFEPYP